MLTLLLSCIQILDLTVPPELGPIELDSTSAQSAPGVLLVVLDDLGYGDTSISAFTEVIQDSDPDWEPDIQTPSMEAFSTQSLSLTSFRTDSPVCAPTRAALMTGLQPHVAGFWSANTNWYGADNQLGLRPGLVLLPELLSAAGFATSMVGKWHLGDQSAPWDPTGGKESCLAANTPDTRGFDHVFGFLRATHNYSIDEFCGSLIEGGAGRGIASPGADSDGCPYIGEHTTEVFTDQAIEQLTALQDSGDPWFLYVAYNAPHTPVGDGADWIRAAAESDHPDAAAYAEMVVACEAPENRNLEMGGSDFCLLVSHLDAHLGRLLAAAPDDILVIVMSDNGGQEGAGASNAHFRGTKGNVFNGGTVVPLMVRGPEMPADMVLNASITSAELFPTILEYAGVSVPENQEVADFPDSCDATLPLDDVPLASESRLSLLRDGDSGCRREIFQENTGQVALIWQEEDTAENWKLMADLLRSLSDGSGEQPICDPSWQLYDQQVDMEEQSNLIESEPELAEAMLQALSARMMALPHVHDQVAWQVCCFEADGEDCEAACGECWSSQ